MNVLYVLCVCVCCALCTSSLVVVPDVVRLRISVCDFPSTNHPLSAQPHLRQRSVHGVMIICAALRWSSGFGRCGRADTLSSFRVHMFGVGNARRTRRIDTFKLVGRRRVVVAQKPTHGSRACAKCSRVHHKVLLLERSCEAPEMRFHTHSLVVYVSWGFFSYEGCWRQLHLNRNAVPSSQSCGAMNATEMKSTMVYVFLMLFMQSIIICCFGFSILHHKWYMHTLSAMRCESTSTSAHVP